MPRVTLTSFQQFRVFLNLIKFITLLYLYCVSLKFRTNCQMSKCRACETSSVSPVCRLCPRKKMRAQPDYGVKKYSEKRELKGARGYGISLRVFNSESHEWSRHWSWTQEDKLNIYKQMAYYHMTRTAPRAISLENHMKKGPVWGLYASKW